MNKNIAISLQNISKVYKLYDKPVDRLKESLNPFKKKYHKEFYALRNINLEVKKGEVLGIVGVNGAGKSTLLKIISGVLTPTSGRVNIHGRINAILELGSSLKPELTGRENIKLNLQINSIEKDREKITQEIVEFADIGEHIDQPVKSYSSGMKARLGFGIATSTDPDILIVDEVLAVGDVLFKRKCYSRIENLFKDGKTVIFVSHSAQSVVEFCSRAVLLYDREIIMDDTPKKVTDYYQKLVFSKDKQKVIDDMNEKAEVKEEEQKQELNKNPNYNNNNFLKKYIDISNEKLDFLENLNVSPSYISEKLFTIKNLSIIDSSGYDVNILKTENYYNIEFDFLFPEGFPIKNLINGITFVNTKGIHVVGLKLNNFTIINSNIIHFKKEFKCILNEDIYSLIVAVRENSKELSFYFRATDAMLFQVKKNDISDVRWGLVQL
ncbi:MAG: ABC transporter ATP-binding protein [Sulfurimonadaceae bacterium]|jgi:ABC-type polysaccharide/polyol phosphate transport system ATPase subunit|nr:ABC transporter ATP-binding protein [Sulfurimonadaceae bacterium]